MNNQEKNIKNDHNALIGLHHFLIAIQDKNVAPRNYAVEDFCFKTDDLLRGLYSIISGRFKCDGGLSHLSDVFKEAMTANPCMAQKYFYTYSQLMELLVSIYNVESYIMHYSSIFEDLSKKALIFERPGNTADNEPLSV